MAKKNGQILPFTLTELFALLFFALALALAHESIKRREAQTQLEENSALLAASSSMGPDASKSLGRILSSMRDSLPEDFEELTRRLQSTEEVRTALERELRESGLDSVHVDTLTMEALVDSVLALKGRSDKEAEMLAAAGNFSDSTKSLLERIVEQAQRADADRRASDREKVDLRAQLTYLQRRVGNGLDHPPCWADAEGRPEFAFEVVLQTTTVSVRPAWPEHRRGDAAQVSGMMGAIGENMSYATFSARARPILEWSKRQIPECRHFVLIVDRVDGGKEPFKAGLLTVEHFFYKLLTN